MWIRRSISKACKVSVQKWKLCAPNNLRPTKPHAHAAAGWQNQKGSKSDPKPELLPFWFLSVQNRQLATLQTILTSQLQQDIMDALACAAEPFLVLCGDFLGSITAVVEIPCHLFNCQALTLDFF